MKQILEDLFDLFFPSVDNDGNIIENPEEDESFSSKMVYLSLLVIIIILTGIALN